MVGLWVLPGCRLGGLGRMEGRLYQYAWGDGQRFVSDKLVQTMREREEEGREAGVLRQSRRER